MPRKKSVLDVTRPTYIRIKQEGMSCIELDANKVHGFSIIPTGESDGEYMLVAAMATDDIILCVGQVDTCHMLLNALHQTLNIQVVDLAY